MNIPRYYSLEYRGKVLRKFYKILDLLICAWIGHEDKPQGRHKEYKCIRCGQLRKEHVMIHGHVFTYREDDTFKCYCGEVDNRYKK